MEWASLVISVIALGLSGLATRNSHRASVASNHRADRPSIVAQSSGAYDQMGVQCKVTSTRDLDAVVLAISHVEVGDRSAPHRGLWADMMKNIGYQHESHNQAITFRHVRAGKPFFVNVGVDVDPGDQVGFTLRAECREGDREPWIVTAKVEPVKASPAHLRRS